MSKKKPKRVDAKRAIDSEMAAKRQRFCETGAPASLLMLLAFVVVCGLIFTFHGEAELVEGHDDVHGHLSWLRMFIVVTSFLLMLGLGLGFYIAAYEPSIVKRHGKGFVLLGALVVMVALVRLGAIFGLSPYLLVVPAMIVAIMITIGYSQRFALGIGSFFVMVSALGMCQTGELRAQALGVLLTTGMGMGIAVLLLGDIHTRSRLLEVCLVSALVVFAMAWLVGLWQNEGIGVILRNSMWGGMGALSVGFLMQGLLPLIERLFCTVTGMTLLDYGEATKPLLKRLAVEAPGTFSHSWQIGMLAEAAAESIGANGLLCRVGSYYHDVGKLNKPRYFVENQSESFNQHERLSPTMSRMIIIGHIKDGLELAREYHLPRVLHQFIETHHGTTLVEFFYHEAKKQSEETGEPVDETEFRYPGPKPQTKEAAVVMLADAVESATRAMQEPTPSRIETLVHGMAMKRLQDGQFDQCDLTMRDLQRLEAGLVKSLCGMYHGRIAYPKQESQGVASKYRKKNNGRENGAIGNSNDASNG